MDEIEAIKEEQEEKQKNDIEKQKKINEINGKNRL